MDKTLLQGLMVAPDASIADALRSIEASSFPLVLICNEKQRLVGIVTEGDIRRALLEGCGLSSPLHPLINSNPVVGTVSDSREELVSRLSDSIRFLPITDLEGIVQDLLLFDRRNFIPIAVPAIGGRELELVTEAVLSGWVSSQGKFIDQFEEKFAEFCGTRYAVAVSNGTVALHLALVAHGIGIGDEVIVPALTFVSPASVTKVCQATPVFVDVDPLTWTLNPKKLEAAISPRTKAIIPVHLYGNPCDMGPILEIARKHSLLVIEDAAEAHGACIGQKVVGSFGDAGCFSFYGNKILTTGEGGAVVCNDVELYKRLRILRDHGMTPERRYWHEFVGFNYRMTNLQAALGCAQIERIDQLLLAKERVRRFYNRALDLSVFDVPQAPPLGHSVCWLYTLALNPERASISRDQLLEELKKNEIDCRPVFIPLPAMPPYYEEMWEDKYSVAKDLSSHGISFPSSVELKEEELARIVNVVNALCVGEKKKLAYG